MRWERHIEGLEGREVWEEVVEVEALGLVGRASYQHGTDRYVKIVT